MRIFKLSIFYFLALITANGLLWGLCMAYLKFAPVYYESDFTLIIPRTDSRTIADIDGVGRVSAEQKPVFNSELADPRSDYIYVLQSSPFLAMVAKSLNMKPQDLGEPVTKALDNSGILRVSIKGDTPEQAQKKAEAIYLTFVERVNQLRQEEQRLRINTSENNLAQTSEDLKNAQQKLLDFQKQSGFNSPDQINLLAGSIEEIRRNKAQVDAELSSIEQNFKALTDTLSITPQNAVWAFTLNADQLFQLLLQEYNDSTTKLAILTEKLESNHPDVVKEASRQQVATQKLNQRGRQLIGESFNLDLLGLLNLSSQDSSTGRKTLYEDIISLNAQKASLKAKSAELQTKLENFQKLYIQQIQYREVYENLSRNLRIAESLFSSNVTTTKGKDHNPFASYPLFQLLTSASLPDEPSSPKTLFALLGASFGSILVTLGILLLWFRSIQFANQHKESSIDYEIIEKDEIITKDEIIEEEDRSTESMTSPNDEQEEYCPQ